MHPSDFGTVRVTDVLDCPSSGDSDVIRVTDMVIVRVVDMAVVRVADTSDRPSSGDPNAIRVTSWVVEIDLGPSVVWTLRFMIL